MPVQDKHTEVYLSLILAKIVMLWDCKNLDICYDSKQSYVNNFLLVQFSALSEAGPRAISSGLCMRTYEFLSCMRQWINILEGLAVIIARKRSSLVLVICTQHYENRSKAIQSQNRSEELRHVNNNLHLREFIRCFVIISIEFRNTRTIRVNACLSYPYPLNFWSNF